ncbi:MAG: flavodoxin family protein [Patescibacteria group bacterium]
MKKLVVFYSLDGSTKFIANIIAEKTGAELLELKPIKPISSKGFGKMFWGGKQVMMKHKPDLEPFDKDPQDYDLIFIGTPVWAWTFTPALRTFFSQVKLQNKKIALFDCNGGQPKDTLNDMAKELEGNEIIGQYEFEEPIKRQEAAREMAEKWAGEVLNKLNE